MSLLRRLFPNPLNFFLPKQKSGWHQRAVQQMNDPAWQTRQFYNYHHYINWANDMPSVTSILSEDEFNSLKLKQLS